MDYFIDWNCQLFPSIRIGSTTFSDAVETMSFLHDRDRISHFCLISEYTTAYGPIPAFLIWRNRLANELKAQIPKGVKLQFATSTPVFQGLHQMDDLERLFLNADRLLPITLPMALYEDWIDLELNRLLYQRNIRPMFISFDFAVKLYSHEVIQKLLRISNAVYQFNYRSLTDERVIRAISHLLRNHPQATILLGTSIDCFERASFHETEYYLQTAAKYLSPLEYQILLHQGRAFWKNFSHRI